LRGQRQRRRQHARGDDCEEQNTREDDPGEPEGLDALLPQRRTARPVDLQELRLSRALEASGRPQGYEADRRDRSRHGQAAARADPGRLPRRPALPVHGRPQARRHQGQRVQGCRHLAGRHHREGVDDVNWHDDDRTAPDLPLTASRTAPERPVLPGPFRRCRVHFFAAQWGNRCMVRPWQTVSALGALARNANLRRVELAWGASIAAEWTHFVALGVFAYTEGGAAAVGIAGLVRMLPAALVAPFASTLG